MTTPNRKGGPRNADFDGEVRRLVDDLGPLIEHLEAVQQRARALGIFTNDRELLVCPNCGLAEDVLADGRLATFHGVGDPDPGRRFIEPNADGAPFLCPECGSEAREQQPDP